MYLLTYDLVYFISLEMYISTIIVFTFVEHSHVIIISSLVTRVLDHYYARTYGQSCYTDKKFFLTTSIHNLYICSQRMFSNDLVLIINSKI